MASRPDLRYPKRLAAAALRWAMLCCVVAAASGAMAQPTQPAGIYYSCIGDRGRRLTADRPIAECNDREQEIHNPDGSLRGKRPPSQTPEERSEQEERERVELAAGEAQKDAVRRDKNLLSFYPNEASHLAAREAALDTVRMAIKATESRLRELAAERKPLLDEAEFYQRKTLPPRLKAAIDANDASREAQRAAAANQEAELGRITRLYDAELNRLRQLWAGAVPGSMGPLPVISPPGRPPGPAAKLPPRQR